ncbi:MAG TPA: hypothetical protein PKX27_00200 [Bacteroidales bacterium]|nr:hypothetical protein [Bacteroidales bacterium]HPM86370.1 hypothetical protein [Bacteroidales bacterium]HQM68555.1 hypothetical protein [Bacteroidales bacterium]
MAEKDYSEMRHASGCSCCGGHHVEPSNDMTRRNFVKVTGTGALGAAVIPGITWAALAGRENGDRTAPGRRTLIVKPVLTCDVPVRRDKTSWRSWGGIQTDKDVISEKARIGEEIKSLSARADFPVNFLPLSEVRKNDDLKGITDMESADLVLIYAAGGSQSIFDSIHKTGKDMIIFCRHKSGPVYLWYEIISPRYLRQHTDALALKGVNENDVVIDSQDELLWRLRSVCGLKNTVGSKILAIGGPGAWAQPLDYTMKTVSSRYKLNVQDITYDELGKLITEARADKSVILDAKSRADKYLQDSGISLVTDRKFVENCFVLEDILVRLMEKYNCRAVTVNNCMGTIMPLAETTACLTLSLLNDEGYLAFCESDFVVVPAGILMANISGKPSFLNDPTYPHDNIITLAHCTAPRKMDGKNSEPAKLLTHFESDYGAAPKVEMKIGQVVTNIMPDFEFNRNVGLSGKIVSNPFMDICRSQIDISFSCDSKIVAERMPGFHWITVYGDYLKEAGYALKKIGIGFENLG